MAKSFKKSNPLNNLNKDSLISGPTPEPTPIAKPKYLRLDLKGNSHSYISFMANVQNISMTEYINNLIEADKDRNTEAYNKFLEIERIKNNI